MNESIDNRPDKPYPANSAIPVASRRRNRPSGPGRVVFGVISGLVVLAVLFYVATRESPFFRFLFEDREEVVGRLVEDLQEGDYTIQSRAIDELSEIGGDEAADALVRVAESKEGYIRNNALQALGKIGGDHAMKGLLGFFENQDGEAQIGAAFALSRIGQPAVARLIGILDSGTGETSRFLAAYALARINSPEASVRLDAAFEQEDLLVVSGAVDYYIRLGKAGTEAILIKALNRYGKVLTASSLLNSGNTQLSDAARVWAGENGYKVTDSIFTQSAYAHWGRK